MTDTLLVAAVVLAAFGVLIQVVLLLRQGRIEPASFQQALQSLERLLREELSKTRDESNEAARQSREELVTSLKGVGDSLNQQISILTQTIDQRFDRLRQAVDLRLQAIQSDSAAAAKELRQEVGSTLKGFNDSVLAGMAGMVESQNKQMAAFSEQLGKLIESNQQKLEGLKGAIEEKLNSIQTDNAKQLDLMRATVDEKLQTTLEKRLGESFRLVSDRLEQVYKGLGEMQALAIGVGDLKKVLTNVKSRGTWGEVQLGAMLEQVLSPNQYATNVATKGDSERVEFAIRLPGRGETRDDVVWLPVDAKFPIEDYHRLVEAQEKADPEAAEMAANQLELRIKQCAAEICAKYISPPKTTDFGILYLPTEGLFAEVIRRIGLAEYVQRECRVVIAGPTTLWSILNSLQMGFRTLAIEKRSSEVWKILGAVKCEFGKFGDLLEGIKRRLDQASNTIDDAARKSRTIERRLRGVQELPAADAEALIGIPMAGDGEPESS